jgi:hypothetical protein
MMRKTPFNAAQHSISTKQRVEYHQNGHSPPCLNHLASCDRRPILDSIVLVLTLPKQTVKCIVGNNPVSADMRGQLKIRGSLIPPQKIAKSLPRSVVVILNNASYQLI